MKKTKDFNSCDLYVFDLKLCPVKDGWAQIDTKQDARYFRTWANPFQLKIVNYVEGDIYIYILLNVKMIKSLFVN